MSKTSPVMPLGFYVIMAAQFCSALADNAILILAIHILNAPGAPGANEPLLRVFFSISYVTLAAFVGAFADSMPKWRVMLISNTVKIGGCMLLLANVHPMIAYGIIGLGAAAYSPAKYGILTEYLPHSKLVIANGWIEGLTIGAIILGTVMGGKLTKEEVGIWFASFDIPLFNTGAHAAVAVIGLLYLLAALFNLFIPDTGVDSKPLRSSPIYLVHDFYHSLKLLWRDKLGQISLAATTLVWGVTGVLHLLVLKWAEVNLGMDKLDKQTDMVGVVAVGLAAGAVLASRFMALRQSVKVLPLGIFTGFVFLLMPFVTNYYIAIVMLVVIGACGGFFVVPMNALLQHRGHVLMGAGHSIAVQNFNENSSILLMSAIYAAMIFADLSVGHVFVFFGLLMSSMLFLTLRWHQSNQRRFNVMDQLSDTHLSKGHIRPH